MSFRSTHRVLTRAVSLVFASGLLASFAGVSLLAARMPASDIAFAVYRDGAPLGSHEVRFRRVGEDLHVEIEIDLEVRLAFLTLFRYSHRNHEVWRNGRLVSIETWTDDDGTSYRVTGRATAQGFVVDGDDGVRLLPAEIIPTSYWNPATVLQTALLDTQRGRLLEVALREAGSETVSLGDRDVAATRYAMTGDLELDLWYGDAGEWLRIAFEARGTTVSYSRMGGAQDHPALRHFAADE